MLGLCCGRGKSAIVWALRGARKVTGIDLSSLALDIARQNALLNQVAERIGFREMPAEDLDFPDESFDVIVGIDALHHTDLPLCLHEIFRVLRKGRRSRSLYRNDCPKSRHDVGSSLSRPSLWDLTLSEPNTLLHGRISSSWPGFSHGLGGLAPPCSSNFAASLSSPPGKPGSTDGMSHCFVPSLGSVRSVTTRQSNCSNRGRWIRCASRHTPREGAGFLWPRPARPLMDADSHRSSPYGFGQCLLADSQSSHARIFVVFFAWPRCGCLGASVGHVASLRRGSSRLGMAPESPWETPQGRAERHGSGFGHWETGWK